MSPPILLQFWDNGMRDDRAANRSAKSGHDNCRSGKPSKAPNDCVRAVPRGGVKSPGSTAGGVGPAGACPTAGIEQRVDYTADYIFYK
jgi:hypothetical protein